MVTATVAAGISVIAVGLLLIIVGLALLVKAMSQVRKGVQNIAKKLEGAGVIPDPAEFLKQIIALIDKVGVALGIPLVIMVMGMFLVGVGAAVIGVSA